MKLKLFLMLLFAATIPALAQRASLRGSVVEADTGNPIAGALVTVQNQGITVTTGPAGDFTISNAQPGQALIVAVAAGYNDASVSADLYAGQTIDLGQIIMVDENAASAYYEENQDMWYDENLIEDEESTAQSISALNGASDDVYYNAQSYNFQPMYFRYRGYNQEYQETYINGVSLNDLGRGRFSYSTLGGMTSRAFRNRTSTLGLAAASYGFGEIGGSTNISTITSQYAPGFNGSVAYTNSNYMLRAMATYSTGINKHGWGLTASVIGRYANEGVQEGTFYNSFGAFLSLEKVFNKNHSLTLTAWGAPTQRGGASSTYQEAYDLAGSNLYNPSWGWQDGKKRNSKIIEQFDPTAMLNWLYNTDKTQVNTAVVTRWTHYSSSALNWYQAADPRPDYYRYLPSYYMEDGEATELSDFYTQIWSQKANRQINWDNLYQTNYLNNLNNEDPNATQKGSTYILENRVSNQFNFILNSYINHRLNDKMSLQGGASFNYTKADYFKTIRDLLGGQYWLDIDNFSERDFPSDTEILQNDLNNPNRKVGKGDKFGYNYTINAIQATAWLQNVINLPQWDINYGLKMGYTQFQRDGHYRNGRAPENSYGKGTMHRFDTGALKAGATYKIDGRNFISAHATYETKAPLFEYSYISPRIKDDAIYDLQNERIFSADLSYAWNYRRFRGSITGFWTEMFNMSERTSYYDDQLSTFVNYVLSNVHQRYRGVELGLAYKITPSVTASFAGTLSQYQYRNHPTGVKSVENGSSDDLFETVYLKNYYVGGTPQKAFNVGIDWQAPKNWFFNINGSWMGDAYVNLAPMRHAILEDLWQQYPNKEELEARVAEIADQQKLKDAFVLNASIGKLVYINRKVSMNFNLSATNLLNNRNIMTYGYQQGRMKDYNIEQFPNKYSYAQGIKIFLNVGVRF